MQQSGYVNWLADKRQVVFSLDAAESELSAWEVKKTTGCW
jgi:hypothetical protein